MRRPYAAREKPCAFFQRALRRGQTDPLGRRLANGFEPLECQRHVCSALGACQRVNLINDDRFDPGQPGASLRREHQIQRLGRRDQNVRRSPSLAGVAFVTRIARESGLIYSTFLGGTGYDTALTLALDAQGATTFVGFTNSSDFPVTDGALDTEYNGHGDAFVTRLSASGSRLLYSTFLGGTGHDSASSLDLDALGRATVTGRTTSTNFPLALGPGSAPSGGDDKAFVVHLPMLPTGVEAYGSSSPGCTGSLAISVTSIPRVGNSEFSLTCSNAPPNASGGIITGASGFVPPLEPLTVLGAAMWVDPSGVFLITGSVHSDQNGVAEYALPIPTNPAVRGARLYAQFAWMGRPAPAPCPATGLSASAALDITVQ